VIIHTYFPVCDPVMGDNKQMYVPNEILDVYKNDIINLTDILTPNEYELEYKYFITIFFIFTSYFYVFIRLLTGITITTI